MMVPTSLRQIFCSRMQLDGSSRRRVFDRAKINRIQTQYPSNFREIESIDFTLKPTTKIIPLTQTKTQVQKMLKRVPTSLRQQINRIQTQYPSHIILTQVGMFYEIIGDYIEEICSILNLRIGSRKVLSEDPRMAGFPVYELNKYANCLLKHGKSVCIVDQMEQHPTSDVTPRKVVRILTPGTLLDDGEFTSIDNNFLLSVYRKSKTSKTLGLSWIDISTGEFLMTDSSLSDFPNFISRIQPKEIIVSESLNCWSDSLNRLLKPTEIENIVLTVKSDNFFISSTAEAHLASVVIVNEPHKQILKTTPSMVLKNIPEPQLKSAIGLVAYIQENFPTICPPIRTPLNVNSETMKIDFNTIQALEIIQTQKNRQREGSLISVMATTRTPGGKRLLASRIKAPSTSLKEIESRLDLVQLFHDDLYLSRVVSDELSNIKDIEKALQRLHVSHSVSDLFVVLDGLRVVEKLKLLLKGRKIIMKQLVKGLGKLKSAWEKYDGLLNINNLENGKITGTDVLMGGYCDKIDDLRIYLAKLKSEEEEKIDVMDALFEKKCALKWDDKLGVAYVEIVNGSGETNRRINKIIDRVDTFTNKSSTARMIKFHDQAWTELYKKKQETTVELISLQNEKLAEACDKLKQFTKEIIEICKTISELDVACTFGLFASKNQYSRPKMTKEMIHEVKGGRHPVVERHQLLRGNSFVANDTKLSAKSICVLTGPNMGGKSTYLRQAAIISILAQSGLFVPCGSAKLGILDQIFTRIGSSDDLSNNESTFMVFKANKVEMKETAHILHNATEQSLIIMDEVGRGTSTKDGLAIAYSIIAYISKVNKSLCLFATHYHELNSLIEKFKVENVVYSKAVCKVDDNELTCLYKIEDGVMDKSHGIKIAKHAGIPVGVVQNAEKIYDYLENSE